MQRLLLRQLGPEISEVEAHRWSSRISLVSHVVVFHTPWEPWGLWLEMLEPPELELQLQSVQRQDVDVAKESEVKHEAFRLRHWKPSPAKAFPSSQQGLAAIAGHQDLQRSFSVQIPGAMQGLVARPLHNSHSNSNSKNSQSWLRHRRGQHGWCGRRCCCHWLQLLQLQPETPRRPRSPIVESPSRSQSSAAKLLQQPLETSQTKAVSPQNLYLNM